MPVAKEKPDSRAQALAARRRKILEAAVMCFLEIGYHQTGVRDIAARAGVSLGNLYNHFPSKHDVLIEISRLEQQELTAFAEQLTKPGPAPKRFDQFVTSYAKYLSSAENVILSIEITSEAIRQKDLGDLFTENRELLVTALQALLQQGQDQGAFRLSASPRDTAFQVLELIEGRAYYSVLGGPHMRRLLPGIRAFLNAAIGVVDR